VTTLGVDEHVWHHVDPRKRGPKELTGMVDLTRDNHGNTRARLLDLVPGRSGKAYATWLGERGDSFRRQVKIAALDPFAGYRTPSATGAARATRSTECRPSSARERRTSPTVSARG
jgi:transposase